MALTFDDDLFPTVSKVLTVGELTRAIRGTLETKFGAVWVQGEISNYKLLPSGHQYFTLCLRSKTQQQEQSHYA